MGDLTPTLSLSGTSSASSSASSDDYYLLTQEILIFSIISNFF